mgnify:CR=1 FL=1
MKGGPKFDFTGKVQFGEVLAEKQHWELEFKPVDNGGSEVDYGFKVQYSVGRCTKQ